MNIYNNIARLTLILILSVNLIISGNIISAFLHSNCFINDNVHLVCEMDCCKQTSCCEEEQQSNFEYLDDIASDCCIKHYDNQSENTIVIYSNNLFFKFDYNFLNYSEQYYNSENLESISLKTPEFLHPQKFIQTTILRI